MADPRGLRAGESRAGSTRPEDSAPGTAGKGPGTAAGLLLRRRVHLARQDRVRRARLLADRLRARILACDSSPAGRAAGGAADADNGVLRWVCDLTGIPAGVPGYGQELARRMGPDLFGMLALPPPPPFLAGLGPDALPAEHVAPFLRRVSMTRPAPAPADLAPAALAADPGPVSRHPRAPLQRRWAQPPGAPLLPPRTDIPHVIHGIWLGGPLPDPSPLRTSFAAAAAHYAGRADIVLWTDVPRFDLTAAAASPPPPGAPDPHAPARSLLTWATRHGIHLVNVHEIFHAARPMTLHHQYTAETSKQLPRGYAGASDHLRIEIIYLLGGAYVDGDNHFPPVRPGLPALFDAVAVSPHAITLHVRPQGVNNDVIIAPARHPALALWRELARARYLLTQRELFGGLDNMARRYAEQPQALLRYSVVHRSGRVHHQLLARLRIPGDDRRLVRVDSAVRHGRDLSWSRNHPAPPPAPLTPDQVTTITARAITTLARQLITREGNLHLTAVAPVIAALPDPDAAWTAALTLLAELTTNGTLPSVTSITQFRWADNGTPEHTTLPPEAEALLHRHPPIPPGSATTSPPPATPPGSSTKPPPPPLSGPVPPRHHLPPYCATPRS